jgi:hypothetical protein
MSLFDMLKAKAAELLTDWITPGFLEADRSGKDGRRGSSEHSDVASSQLPRVAGF